ncbi:MAG: glycosyltransferase [Flavobacteriales bacterium]|nr:glycosyltransferase [Flavobacteriales bacterium]
MTSLYPTYSLIIPTFGRPDEVYEFLESLTHSTYKNFEVIIADGTPQKSLEEIARPFYNQIPVTFIYEEYLPVSDARNRGASVAKGDYFIFLDSDCIIPHDYLEKVDSFLKKCPVDLFGGPDAAHESFTSIQKAISYSMTSFFTTGGIRGNKKHVGVFHPRGFNMGISRKAFEQVKGYDTKFRCGEDIDLSIRVLKAGFKSALIPDARVYHKRRTDFQKFFKQVFRFGAARINLFVRHKSELKITHLFPFIFTLYLFLGAFTVFIWPTVFVFWFLSLLFYSLFIFIDSSIKNNNIWVGVLSIRAAFTQLIGYGWGFFRNGVEVFVKGNKNGLKL